MSVDLKFVTTLPAPAAFESLMREYYQIMGEKLVNAGGPQLSAQGMAKDTIAHMDELLPPSGRTLLATREDGALVGCGVIRTIRDDAAELKRMYVRPDAQGMGLGRQLFELRIAEARKMGCKFAYADTVRGNTAMLSMYEAFGFKYISRYSENANPAELDPYLVYLELRIV